jgi:hypothetical protein
MIGTFPDGAAVFAKNLQEIINMYLKYVSISVREKRNIYLYNLSLFS